jgi:ATP-dependent Clp protease ATP-binding subunit ClpC
MTRKKTQHVSEAVSRLVELGAIDLTARALAGELPRAFGRDADVQRVFASLGEKRSVLLLGEPGVGKTVILYEAINRIARGEAQAPLQDRHFVQVSTGAIERSSQNAGMWAGNLQAVVDAVIAGKQILVYYEDISNLRDAGRYSDRVESFATHLRPYLERKAITLLGESTPEAYTRSSSHSTMFSKGLVLADDPSLMALFDIHRVDEPDQSAVKAIIAAVTARWERSRNVRVLPTARDRAIELTRRFQPYRSFPGKALALLEEVVRAVDGKQPAPAAGTRSVPAVPPDALTVTPEMVMAAFGRATKLPDQLFSDERPLTQEAIRAYFSERVVGQDEAVGAVVDIVTLIKAELHDPHRPLGVLLFAGPTGSGKTLLAKTLAEYLFGTGDRMVRLDMSEYKHPDSVVGLTRTLTERLRQETFSVLLLDEVEKAWAEVFDLFLQAFDDARLTDPTGRTVDLRNTIIILTTNLGGGSARQRSVGFASAEAAARHQHEQREQRLRAVEGFFRPELLNRLDKVVVFRPLATEDMRRIVRRELGRALLREGVLRRNILLDFRDDVLDVLVEAGFSEEYGARPLQRAIREHVLLPLARRIAAAPAAGNELLELQAAGSRIEFVPIPITDPPTGNETARSARAERAPEGSDHAVPEPDVAAPRSAGAVQPTGVRQLAQAVSALEERLRGLASSRRFKAVEERARRLMALTGEPAFWDDPPRSREVLGTVYHLERVTDRFAELLGRVERLAGVPAALERTGDRSGIARLAETVAALEQNAALAELELLACDAPQIGAARITVMPVSTGRGDAPGDWPDVLLQQYAAWAKQRGYEAESESPDGQGADSLAGDGATRTLVIRGVGVLSMLAGEAGLHKRQSQVEDKRGRKHTEVHVARVTAVPADAPPPEGREGTDTLVRVYNFGHTHYVRDPRTGVRINTPRSVHAGEIEPFLLAYLQNTATVANDSGEEASASDESSGDASI